MIANTDTIHYLQLTSYVYRLLPILLNSQEIQGFHGPNEHISIDNFKKCIEFFIKIIITSEVAQTVAMKNDNRQEL